MSGVLDSAVRQMGTNALPALVSVLNRRDSRLEPLLIWLSQKQRLLRIPYTTASEHRHRALEAFRALIEQLRSTNALGRAIAAIAIGGFGQAARPALPALNLALSDPDSEVRDAAANALEKVEHWPP
jgi:HEAT repeat protein